MAAADIVGKPYCWKEAASPNIVKYATTRSII